MLYIIIALIIIIGILVYKLVRKQRIDTQELENFQTELREIKKEIAYTDNIIKQQEKQVDGLIREAKAKEQECEYAQRRLDQCKKDIQDALDNYNNITETKLKNIDTIIQQQREQREAELGRALEEKQQYYNKLLEDTIAQCSQQDEVIKEASETKWREAMEQIEQYNKSIAEAKDRFESIERTLRQYDAEQQAKLFYTIQLPEEYKEDIDFLLIAVAAKVQHPDIISKLVWQEYVKPNLDNTFKRIEVRSEPGIYKLTSLQDGKCYIGKSTDVKKRISDHFKSVVGIKSIADQAVHHAILKEGFWNWQIEIITYCDKEQLNELEKYYIEFFKAQEFGYNKNSGGGG